MASSVSAFDGMNSCCVLPRKRFLDDSSNEDVSDSTQPRMKVARTLSDTSDQVCHQSLKKNERKERQPLMKLLLELAPTVYSEADEPGTKPLSLSPDLLRSEKLESKGMSLEKKHHKKASKNQSTVSNAKQIDDLIDSLFETTPKKEQKSEVDFSDDEEMSFNSWHVNTLNNLHEYSDKVAFNESSPIKRQRPQVKSFQEKNKSGVPGQISKTELFRAQTKVDFDEPIVVRSKKPSQIHQFKDMDEMFECLFGESPKKMKQSAAKPLKERKSNTKSHKRDVIGTDEMADVNIDKKISTKKSSNDLDDVENIKINKPAHKNHVRDCDELIDSLFGISPQKTEKPKVNILTDKKGTKNSLKRKDTEMDVFKVMDLNKTSSKPPTLELDGIEILEDENNNRLPCPPSKRQIINDDLPQKTGKSTANPVKRFKFLSKTSDSDNTLVVKTRKSMSEKDTPKNGIKSTTLSIESKYLLSNVSSANKDVNKNRKSEKCVVSSPSFGNDLTKEKKSKVFVEAKKPILSTKVRNLTDKIWQHRGYGDKRVREIQPQKSPVNYSSSMRSTSEINNAEAVICTSNFRQSFSSFKIPKKTQA